MDLPTIGKKVPRRGHRAWSRMARLVFSGFGWTFEGELPDLPKFVIIGAPHTSNWDFVVAMLTIFCLDMDIHWIGKHTIFRWPFSGLMKWLGGTPVNRSKPESIVHQVVDEFRAREKFLLAIAPEGTRKKVDHWKTGFHRIASRAGVPVVPAYLDFGRKVIGFGEPFEPCDDPQVDIEMLLTFYSRFKGKKPHQF